MFDDRSETKRKEKKDIVRYVIRKGKIVTTGVSGIRGST
jgi:hypothetical protein